MITKVRLLQVVEVEEMVVDEAVAITKAVAVTKVGVDFRVEDIKVEVAVVEDMTMSPPTTLNSLIHAVIIIINRLHLNLRTKHRLSSSMVSHHRRSNTILVVARPVKVPQVHLRFLLRDQIVRVDIGNGTHDTPSPCGAVMTMLPSKTCRCLIRS